MGVPKFFRYISERYPCLSEVVKDYQIPVFDNLYLDMNGIIHMCSHPDDADPHFRITEEKIFSDIFHYIEVLFCMIRPQKLFFMAIDGVAPRAKMNQQRARRFNSAKDAEKMEELARKKGETLPTEARFDSNCITPGTVFMARLQEQLKYFVVNKISTDKLWAQCTIILSGHNTPGEGEHKIMDYIRYLRSQKDYDPNTRHCLYGLDADLIMLGLCTHEPHFSLLREQVRFGKKSTKRKNIPEEITFYLLHLSLMREYLELEFASLKDLLEFGFDIEKIIDDWVLMGFLVGNDFIPNLPNMHIANGALPILYKTYMKVLPTLGGYINESGTLNLERFEKFMNELSSIDIDNFTEIYSDLKYFEQKTGRKFLEPFEESATKEEEVEIEEEICEPEVEASSDDEDESLLEEFRLHKRDYYVNKLEYANVTSDVLKDQAEGYVKAIQWNLNYYYNGCCSWSWYYPHHYAPYISDIKGFSNLKIEFEHGTPFKPYEQLLAVLPAASKTLLPNVYHDLMTEDSSPIKKYYPLEFKKDLNGKKQDWEAVVLVPFIDEEQLLKAMEPCNQLLTEEEVRRNSHGPMLVYSYTSESLGKYKAPEYFPDVGVNHADCQQLSVEDIKVPVEKLVKGLHPKAMLDVYFPGFPTFKHLKYEGSLEKARVSVFEQPSRGDNMIIKIIRDDQGKDPKSLLGNPVFVAWPHMVEAMVTCVSDENFRYKSIETPGHHHEEENKGDLKAVWLQQLEGITEHYKNRLGIDVGPTETLVEVRTMVGRRYMFTQHGRATLEKRWADIPSYYPLQTIVRDIPAHDDHHTTYVDLGSMFPVGSTCFMLGYPHHGASGVVLNDVESIRQGRIKVCIKSVPEPYLEDVKKLACKYEETYMPLMTAASRVALSRHVFSRITGTVFVVPKKQANESDSIRKANLGLNLKFNMKNQETPGYTRKIQGDWWYSEKTVQLVHDYMIVCPELFEFLNYNPKCSNVIQELVFPERSEERIKELLEWLKKQPASSVERQACGSQSLEPELVKRIEEIVDEDQKHPGAAKDVVLKIRPHLLYKPELQMGALLPDPSAIYKMLDRVVNVREGYTVPLGLKGTIVGIHKVPNEEDSYDIVFDKPFNGGLVLNGCSPGRGYKLSKLALINVSHGIRVYEEKTGKPGQLQKTLDAMQIKDKVKLRDNHSQLEILQRQHVKPGTSIQTAVLNQPPHSLPKQQQQFNPRANTNPVNPSHNRPVINTDTLRRMLKLDDKTSKEMENSHLRQVVPSDTRPMPSTYSMMLASFFHSQGMGWYPTYQYYKLQNNLFTAEVTLPNGSSIRGLPGVAKEQAAENAAKAALDFIKQHNVRTGFVNNPIPPPPMQWMHGQRYASPMLPQGRNNSVFVPLQAMRAPLVRNNATESRGNPPKQAENKPNASDRSPKVDNEKATASTSSQPQAKRRQRKQRLAMQLP